ncbi:uncharacterized protein LOC135113518 [Scylla paramamosain]|uniref:uncharacterized protein LOC135113518 n=1 Tax=Scylla paramamosain TaxID=85552 RepID=UPI003082A760
MTNNPHTTTTMTTTITTIITNAWQHGQEEEEVQIRQLMVVSYWILLPVWLVVGVTLSAVGLYLLHRPRMQGLPITTYMKLLLSLDAGVMVATIATILTLNGCHIHSYAMGLFAHFSFTLFYMFQTFCHYIIVWVCYNRFLALWCFSRFQQTQKPQVIRLRIIFTGVLCVLVNLRHLLDVQVVCMGTAGEVEAAANHTEDCEGGAWVILDSLHQSEMTEVWQMAVWIVRGILVIVMPVFLVLVFNTSIIIGLVRRRLHNAASTSRTRDQAYSSIYISLAISFTSITTAMPTVVHALFFATNIKHCHGPFSEEVFRAIANLLLLGEHLTHILFLAINQTFRDELKMLFHATKRSISKSITCMTQTPISSRQMHPFTVTTNVNMKESPQAPQLVVSAPEEKPDREAIVQIAVPTQASLSALLMNAELHGQDPLRKTRKNENDTQHSARTSIMSLEDGRT